MPLQRCQDETTSTEFVEWKLVLEEEWHTPTKRDYYDAQIAFELARGLQKDYRGESPAAKLIKFEEASKVLSPEDIKAQQEASKAAWLAFAGFNPDGTRIEIGVHRRV
jgi:hypothetical protein